MELEILITSLGMPGFSDAEVEPYGSFLYNAYTRKADLDVSVHISSSLEDADLIAYIWRALVKRNFPILNSAPDARIPLLTFESEEENIACDVTINNHLGEIKSKFLLWISKIDKRFCDMVLLVKERARAHDINNPKEGTFNSYALCLLVIFHFQFSRLEAMAAKFVISTYTGKWEDRSTCRWMAQNHNKLLIHLSYQTMQQGLFQSI